MKPHAPSAPYARSLLAAAIAVAPARSEDWKQIAEQICAPHMPVPGIPSLPPAHAGADWVRFVQQCRISKQPIANAMAVVATAIRERCWTANTDKSVERAIAIASQVTKSLDSINPIEEQWAAVITLLQPKSSLPVPTTSTLLSQLFNTE